MDYKEQIEQAKLAAVKWRTNNPIVGVGELRVDCMVDDLCRSITDLLSRAEAAEARLEMAHAELEAVRKAQMENQARAEKAEKCIAEIEDAIRFGRDSAAMLRIYEWRGQKGE